MIKAARRPNSPEHGKSSLLHVMTHQERYIKTWKLISNNYEKLVVATSNDAQHIYLQWKFSDDGNSVDIVAGRWNTHFNIIREGTSSLELKGTICCAKTALALTKLAREQEFPLTQRGLHWVNEVPYNR